MQQYALKLTKLPNIQKGSKNDDIKNVKKKI